jgi:hypothetical protein
VQPGRDQVAHQGHHVLHRIRQQRIELPEPFRGGAIVTLRRDLGLEDHGVPVAGLGAERAVGLGIGSRTLVAAQIRGRALGEVEPVGRQRVLPRAEALDTALLRPLRSESPQERGAPAVPSGRIDR